MSSTDRTANRVSKPYSRAVDNLSSITSCSAWDKGCSGCTSYVNALGDLSMLNDRDTTFALVSRAPLPKLDVYKAKKGWSVPWFSSFGSDFNYDFHVTNDEKVAPV